MSLLIAQVLFAMVVQMLQLADVHTVGARNISRCWDLIFLRTYHLVCVSPPTAEQIRIKDLVLRSEAEVGGNSMCVHVESFQAVSRISYIHYGKDLRLSSLRVRVSDKKRSSSPSSNGTASRTSFPQIAMKLMFILPYFISQMPSRFGSRPPP